MTRRICHPPGLFLYPHNRLWTGVRPPQPGDSGLTSDPASELLLSRDLLLQLPELGPLAHGRIQAQRHLQRVSRILHPAERGIHDGDMETHVAIAASGL